jgi:hypothetical protein
MMPSTGLAQSTAFTYQGHLRDHGVPANGGYDMRFRLFDASFGGVELDAPECADDEPVINGVFDFVMNFGPQFATTAPRYLQIEIRADNGTIGLPDCANATGFTALSPRQEIRAAPFATHAKSAFTLAAADGSPTNAVFVNNAGNVGVGTTTPQVSLHIAMPEPVLDLQDADSPTAQVGLLRFRNSTGTVGASIGFEDPKTTNATFVNFRSGGNTILGAGGGLSLFITPGSRIGIGTATPSAGLHVTREPTPPGGTMALEGTTHTYMTFFPDGLAAGRKGFIGFASASSNDITIANEIQGGRIVLANTTVVDVMPFGDFANVQWNSNTHQLGIDSSTRRHKQNIKPLEADFERLLEAEPVTYTRPGQPDRWEIGYIAEDMHELGLTNLVSYDAEGRPEGYNYDKSTLYLVAIAKAQRQKLLEQQARLTALEETVRVLARRIEEK